MHDEEDHRRLIRELQRDEPYVERPDELKVDVGGACFMDRNRMCGPDCTAFTDPAAPTAQERCTLLTGASAGLELLQELVQLLRRPAARGAPDIRPPDPFGDHKGR
jgi:hypothetical protein